MAAITAMRLILTFILIANTLRVSNELIYGHTEEPEPAPAPVEAMMPFIILAVLLDRINNRSHFMERGISYAQNPYVLWREQRRLNARENARQPLNDLLTAFENLTDSKKEMLVENKLAVKDSEGNILPLYYCEHINYEMMSHPVQIKVINHNNEEELEIVERESITNYLNNNKNVAQLRSPGTRRLLVTRDIIDTPELQAHYQQYLVDFKNELDRLHSIIEIKIY